MFKHILHILIVITVLMLALAGLAYYEVQAMHTWLNSPRTLAGTPVTLDIPEGTSVRGALRLLIDHGLVDDSLFLRFVGHVGKLPTGIKAGEYEFSPDQTPVEMLTMLSQGRVKTYAITIPEGLTLAEVGALFEPVLPGVSKELIRLAADPEFLKALGVKGLEGFLFPETYKVPKHFPAPRLAKLMVQTYHEFFDRELKAKADELGVSAYDVVTIASIIEKEAGGFEEFPLVSSVIHNRLKKGMPLQMDPTVIYGLTDFSGHLTRHDLMTDHPWNTYTRQGLPKTPICNPGLKALRAAVEPAETPYFYFVSMNNGHHVFSQTLAQHNAAVQKYQIEGKVGP